MLRSSKRLRNNNNIKANDEVIDENDESIVQEIVDKRILNGKVEYRVKYTKHQWIGKQSLGFQQMIDSYEQSLRDNNCENKELIDENELIQINTDYKRVSFDDRVCDDLSEVLLSYLSFEDKFGFECISKQWKSLVFNKQKVLQINFHKNGLVLEKGIFDCKSFEEILLKCKRIDSIDISFQRFDDFYGNKISVEDKISILELITKHCNDLKSIRYDFSGIDMKTIESFGHKFGKSLQVLENIITADNQQINQRINTIFKFCHKLISIKGIYIEDLIDINGELLSETYRLANLDINIDSDCMKVFEKLSKRLIQISQLINLKELQLSFISDIYFADYDYIITSFEISLPLISEKCKKLEKLSFRGEFLNAYIDYNFPLKFITHFIQIKYLSIDLNLFKDENENQLISIESFKDFKHLTHLTVKHLERGDDFYIDIDKHLPQLKVLKVYHSDCASMLTHLTFDHLSKLTNIQILEMSTEMNFNCEAFVKFINNCKQIKSIKLSDTYKKKDFTTETVDSLISLAVKRPEILFTFDFIVPKYIVSYYHKLLNIPNNIYIMF